MLFIVCSPFSTKRVSKFGLYIELWMSNSLGRDHMLDCTVDRCGCLTFFGTCKSWCVEMMCVCWIVCVCLFLVVLRCVESIAVLI